MPQVTKTPAVKETPKPPPTPAPVAKEVVKPTAAPKPTSNETVAKPVEQPVVNDQAQVASPSTPQMTVKASTTCQLL